ncbi:HAAS signaling domain-containing protein [Streptomyces sp. NPDC093089]|uniref:HAAS signaling domain-containing protein n=1 Tax=Streptomyces sp. NPDC093089 TaxID=3366024 RepID=UPI0038243DFC
MTGTEHPLVTDYLATIEREASFLPVGRRAELLADLREHLAVAVGDEQDPAAVRAAVERLGTPSAIVAAARAEEPETAAAPAAPAAEAQPRSRTVATAALLGASGVATLVFDFAGLAALAVGLVLLWTSTAWDRRTKTLATCLTLATPVAAVLGAFLLAARVGPTELLALLAMGIALPVTAAVRLLRARPAAA